MEAEQSSTAAEQRAFAVAKLKRAASLPRMKDGRRPPMHVDGVSEGEKTPANGTESPPTPEVKTEQASEEAKPSEEKKEDIVASNGPVRAEEPHEVTENAEASEVAEISENPEPPRSATTTPEPGRKRRSRSRSRSRGSKDFKGKARATQSPTPSPLVQGNDSSPEDSPPPPPPISIPASPKLVSPIPSHYGELQPSRLLISPRMMSPEHPLLYPGTSPPTPSPMTPMLPTLEALQKGLFRSNSAAARMMAMQKLTGGTDTYEHPSPSPTPPIPSNQLGRSNTVSGGERSAARKMMLRRLGERIKEEHAEQTSGGEEVPPPAPSPKRRRRRSRRSSNAGSTAVEDSDHPSTATNTPIVPSAPLPFSLDHLFPKADLLGRTPSTTPSRTASAQEHALQRDNTLAKLIGSNNTAAEYGPPRKRRSVVVEDEDDVSAEDNPIPPPPALSLPVTPDRNTQPGVRVPYSSDAPSHGSNDTTMSGVELPVYLSATRTSTQPNSFPSSPFGTPLREEKTFRDEDEDAEQVLYQADRAKSPYHDAFDREISWVAEPLPETSIPIQDDYEDDDDDEDYTGDTGAYGHVSNGRQDGGSPHSYSSRRSLEIETETSPEQHPANIPPSPSTALSNTASVARASDDSGSPHPYPARLSVASRIQSDRSPLNTDFELDDPPPRSATAENTLKRTDSASTWEKVKNTFSRSASNGRRSRTNSFARRDNTESSVSRDSGASVGSAKTNKGDSSGTFAYQQTQQPLHHSASASVLSLSPQANLRGTASPTPPALTADLHKYQDSKLFPFPGIKKLEEQRNRARGMSLSLSTPDISLTSAEEAAQNSSSSGTPAQTPERGRERKLSHHPSDSHLLAKFKNASSPQISATPSTSSQLDYFNISPRAPQQNTLASKLPTNREGVRRWLSAKKIFPSVSQPPATSPPSSTSSSVSPPIVDIRPSPATKKPSLSDLLRARKEADLAADWEEVGSEKSRTPTSPTSISGPVLLSKQFGSAEGKEPSNRTPNGSIAAQSDNEKTPKARKVLPHFNATSPRPYIADITPDYPSPPEHPTSTTPDPLSSVSDYPERSTSASSSNTSSQYSQYQTPIHKVPSQGGVVLQRLDEMLGRGLRSPMWASAIDDPPRKLSLSSPVLQVVNSNTVKDRFLFLFNDILVIAKPIVQDPESLMDSSKPNPMDRKFIVKNAVLLRDLRFSADREETHKKTNSISGPPRNPVMRTFVLQFAKDPDHAISSLFEKAGRGVDNVALGQFLFKNLELDRAQLGDYLSRRTSKMVLKAYVDSFGFTGLRVDKALRVFLLSLNIPARTAHTYTYSPLDALLDSFASRWFEANTGIVAYDKELAFRLVRAVVQLNEVLHGGIAQEPGTTGYPRRNITSRDFLEAFRRYDGRGLATDELLSNIYESIRRERLSQARNPAMGGPADVAIVVKRPPPSRLTYSVQSEPVVLRIPQADPQLSIQLYGQGLKFDPPVLTFTKSSEASFRVTGTALGSKTMIMTRFGPNAILYTGLPQSSSVVVERAFMRNTFNLAFSNHSGIKRRYMFSVDDPLIRHQWTVSLKRQIDIAQTSQSRPASVGAQKFHRAAERIAFKVLQEALMNPDPQGPPTRAASPRSPYSSKDSSVFANEQRRGLQSDFRNGNRDSHVRSKSRSQVYHKHGAGRFELDLNQSGYSSYDSTDVDEDGRVANRAGQDHDYRSEGRLWSGRDLELHCQQSSSIALVLSYLQVGSPDFDQHYS